MNTRYIKRLVCRNTCFEFMRLCEPSESFSHATKSLFIVNIRVDACMGIKIRCYQVIYGIFKMVSSTCTFYPVIRIQFVRNYFIFDVLLNDEL